MVEIPEKMFFRIGEVARITSIKTYVLRYWESEFKLLRPIKNKAGQRIYKKKDIETILEIKDLLHKRKFTIAGAKKKLNEEGLARGGHQMELGFMPNATLQSLREIREELAELEKSLR